MFDYGDELDKFVLALDQLCEDLRSCKPWFHKLIAWIGKHI